MEDSFSMGNKIRGGGLRVIPAHDVYCALFLLLEKAMAPTPVLLPGKSHGQRSLVGCSPWGL